jgi:hypothetical protein
MGVNQIRMAISLALINYMHYAYGTRLAELRFACITCSVKKSIHKSHTEETINRTEETVQH